MPPRVYSSCVCWCALEERYQTCVVDGQKEAAAECVEREERERQERERRESKVKHYERSGIRYTLRLHRIVRTVHYKRPGFIVGGLRAGNVGIGIDCIDWA